MTTIVTFSKTFKIHQTLLRKPAHLDILCGDRGKSNLSEKNNKNCGLLRPSVYSDLDFRLDLLVLIILIFSNFNFWALAKAFIYHIKQTDCKNVAQNMCYATLKLSTFQVLRFAYCIFLVMVRRSPIIHW